jgi:hypothetical protein
MKLLFTLLILLTITVVPALAQEVPCAGYGSVCIWMDPQSDDFDTCTCAPGTRCRLVRLVPGMLDEDFRRICVRLIDFELLLELRKIPDSPWKWFGGEYLELSLGIDL